MWGWVCVGLVVVALVAWILSRAAKYGRIFADRHFVEVAQGVARIKSAALSRVIASHDDHVRSPEDPRVLVTSAGLVLLYTVEGAEDRFDHHYSVSVAGGHTARAVGETFVLFVAKLLGVPFEMLALGVGRATVHHADFQLPTAEHAAFAGRHVPKVSQAEIAAFRAESIEARGRLRWKRLDTAPA